ncbi:hypothetical protein CEXT_162421 [Caerostris extrusa]|uniref:Uncharacterized protein n=1 Tax=Caerostris extrusa TaxID=172846 RepID=A0AAV4MAP6_CAEEX|nr:hypothetical protein CEXT_162421 [Caerostris extrusa]
MLYGSGLVISNLKIKNAGGRCFRRFKGEKFDGSHFHLQLTLLTRRTDTILEESGDGIMSSYKGLEESGMNPFSSPKIGSLF